MRLTLATLFVLSAVLAACGGGAAPTRAPGQQTQAPGQATPVPVPTVGSQPNPAPPVGGATVSVTLTGGPTPGNYVGNANPNCSFGFLSPGTWGVSYADDAGGAGLTGVVLVSQPAASGASQGSFSVSVTIGTSALYSVVSAAGSANPAIQISDNGATAVIHASGGTLDGAGALDITVNCPSVTRG